MTTKKTMDRRGFLKAASLGAGASAASAALGVGTAAATENAADRRKARYRETDHVKAYYRTNRY